jgi:hypothetical protein
MGVGDAGGLQWRGCHLVWGVLPTPHWQGSMTAPRRPQAVVITAGWTRLGCDPNGSHPGSHLRSDDLHLGGAELREGRQSPWLEPDRHQVRDAGLDARLVGADLGLGRTNAGPDGVHAAGLTDGQTDPTHQRINLRRCDRSDPGAQRCCTGVGSAELVHLGEQVVERGGERRLLAAGELGTSRSSVVTNVTENGG